MITPALELAIFNYQQAEAEDHVMYERVHKAKQALEKAELEYSRFLSDKRWRLYDLQQELLKKL